MKKILTALLSVLMVATVGIVNVNAEDNIIAVKTIQANVWKSHGATVTYSGNKAKIGTEANGAISWDADGEAITSDGVAVSVKVNTSLEAGQLYVLDVATWNNTTNSYSDEFWIETDANSDGTANVLCGRYANITGKSSLLTTITLNQVHTYTWKFAKKDNKTYAQICIDNYSTEMFEINASDTIGFIWAFGRYYNDNSGEYRLDKTLEIVLEDDVCKDPTEVEVKKWDSFGATVTPTNQGNTIKIGTEANGAISNDAKGKEINEKGITVSTKVNVNLESHGNLFHIDASVNDNDGNRSDEAYVMTQKDGDKYLLTTGYGDKLEAEEGVNTYSWTFVKHGDQTLVSFALNDKSTDFRIMKTGGKTVRNVWAFGRDTTGGYKLDEPLEIYLMATPSYEDITFDEVEPDSTGNVSVIYTGEAVKVAGFDEETLDVDSTYQYQIRKIDGTAQSNPTWIKKTIKNDSTDTLDEIVNVGKYEIKFQVIGDMDEVGKGAQVTYTITVEPSDAEKSFTVDDIPDQTYTGSEIKPKVVVKHGTKTLVEGVDYTVTYENNINVTTKDEPAIASITGKGNYTGTIHKDFNIVAPVIYYVPPVTGVE